MDYSRFHVNLGTKNGINPSKIIRLITDNPSFKSLEIGNIELFKKFSFFEIDKKYEQDVISHFKDIDYEGVPVEIELSKSKATKPINKKAKNSSYGGGKEAFKSKRKSFGEGKPKREGGNRKRRY